MSNGEARWYWTDDLARLLEAGGRTDPITRRWITEPAAIRGEGDAIVVAETLLADESDEVLLAA